MASTRFPLQPVWLGALKELGLRPAEMARRAELPEDLFNQEPPTVDAAGYFRLWTAVYDVVNDPLFALYIGQHIEVERFDPVVYAAMCCPNLNAAAKRVCVFKRLIAPVKLTVEVNAGDTRLTFGPLSDLSPELPPSYESAEVVFWTALVRQTTGERVRPVEVMLRSKVDDGFAEFLGERVKVGPVASVTFSSVDATLPFLTANESVWKHLEPAFNARLADLNAGAETRERIKAVLLELLPSGQSSLDAVGRKLGVGKRTLQRRLTSEETTYQAVLDDTRRHLATHYLERTTLSCAEISFLLGFEDPNSFFRAFHNWTGTTPEKSRADRGADVHV